MNKSKWRIALDILLLLVFVAGLGGAGYYYWFHLGEEEKGAEEIILQPDAGTLDLAAMLKTARETPAGPELPEWQPENLSNRWQSIAVHHSATLSGNASIIEVDHRKRGMTNGLGYHFVIDNGYGGEDGKVEIGSRWVKQFDGGHLKGDDVNRTSIGICLIGDFTKAPPTAKQIASLKALLKSLMKVTLITPGQIKGHRQMPYQATECPGLLPLEAIVQSLQ